MTANVISLRQQTLRRAAAVLTSLQSSCIATSTKHMPAYDIIRRAGDRVVRARRGLTGWGGTAATRLLQQCRSRPSPRLRARARARLRPPAHPPSADQTWSSQHGVAPVHEHSVAEITNLSCRNAACCQQALTRSRTSILVIKGFRTRQLKKWVYTCCLA